MQNWHNNVIKQMLPRVDFISTKTATAVTTFFAVALFVVVFMANNLPLYDDDNYRIPVAYSTPTVIDSTPTVIDSLRPITVSEKALAASCAKLPQMTAANNFESNIRQEKQPGTINFINPSPYKIMAISGVRPESANTFSCFHEILNSSLPVRAGPWC